MATPSVFEIEVYRLSFGWRTFILDQAGSRTEMIRKMLDEAPNYVFSTEERLYVTEPPADPQGIGVIQTEGDDPWEAGAQVVICRIGYATQVMRVEAPTFEAARVKAQAIAPNRFDAHEHASDYIVWSLAPGVEPDAWDPPAP